MSTGCALDENWVNIVVKNSPLFLLGKPYMCKTVYSYWKGQNMKVVVCLLILIQDLHHNLGSLCLAVCLSTTFENRIYSNLIQWGGISRFVVISRYSMNLELFSAPPSSEHAIMILACRLDIVNGLLLHCLISGHCNKSQHWLEYKSGLKTAPYTYGPV